MKEDPPILVDIHKRAFLLMRVDPPIPVDILTRKVHLKRVDLTMDMVGMDLLTLVILATFQMVGVLAISQLEALFHFQFFLTTPYQVLDDPLYKGSLETSSKL